jgi:hypothetical protein
MILHTLEQLRSGALLGVQRLSLAENLQSFPMEILGLADSLEILDLSNNQLSALPDEIVALKKLRILFASNNLFTHLPEILGQFEHLEMIGFKANQIKEVSARSLPRKLRWLILTENRLSSLPESIGHCSLLQKLALAGNQLHDLPKSMGQLHNLQLLRISANALHSCPDHILRLPKLAWLAFAGNPFAKHNMPLLTEHEGNISRVRGDSVSQENVLGQGASGIIYQGKWQRHSSSELIPSEQALLDVAVKVFKGDVTSDGYPEDELQACLQAGAHPNLVKPLALVDEPQQRALVMELIPAHFTNLGLPPSLISCTRDTFADGYQLPITKIVKVVAQMQSVFDHLHQHKVCHGDLYAHNTLVDEQANIIFGDFGAASCYQMLDVSQQGLIQDIERRALAHFVDDLLSICQPEDVLSPEYVKLRADYLA